ncbi:hypothetical protein KBD18_02335 [Patescibacteria group bacterium]|nr:hypothetical protein [Patescibacteria group bacterium]
MNEQKILKKLEEHDKHFVELDHFAKKAIKMLLDHDERLDQITKEQLPALRRELLSALDEQTVILKRLDEERMFSNSRTRRLEDRVDDHDMQLKKLSNKHASA